MFHNSVNFHANHMKLWIWKNQFIKKNIVEVTFFQNFKMAPPATVLYYPCTAISQPILAYKPILDLQH
jgi:hypothetical protein